MNSARNLQMYVANQIARTRTILMYTSYPVTHISRLEIQIMIISRHYKSPPPTITSYIFCNCHRMELQDAT